MIIVGIDPGYMTGMSVMSVVNDKASFLILEESKFDRFPDALDSNLMYRQAIGNRLEENHVVCEDFYLNNDSITKTKGQTNWSIELLGVSRYLARQYGYEFHTQQPNQAKKLVHDSWLKKLGVYMNSDGGHANDAVRHAILLLSKVNKNAFIDLVHRKEAD